jgi:uncharacterized membrane protein
MIDFRCNLSLKTVIRPIMGFELHTEKRPIDIENRLEHTIHSNSLHRGIKTDLMADSVALSLPVQRPRPRIESLTDLVFGLALSIGAISLIGNRPTNSDQLYTAIAGFGFSFLILIQIWFRFTEIMSVLPIQTSETRVLNTVLLFLVALEPYLFNSLGAFFVTSQSSPFDNAASTLYALDIGTIYGILAMFTNILATEERKLVAPDLLRKYKVNRDLEIVVAILFFASTIPIFWSLNLRYFVWATTFFVFRGGTIVRGLRKQSHTSPS